MKTNRLGPKLGTFGDRVRELRTAHGMSQKELAAACGISQPSLSDIENAETDPDLIRATTMARIIKTLDTSVDYLKTGHAESKKQDTLSPQESELLDAFRKLKTPRLRNLLISRAKGMIDGQVTE